VRPAGRAVAAVLALALAACASPGAPSRPAGGADAITGVVEHLEFHHSYAVVMFPWGRQNVGMSPREMQWLRPGDRVFFDRELRPLPPLGRGG